MKRLFSFVVVSTIVIQGIAPLNVHALKFEEVVEQVLLPSVQQTSGRTGGGSRYIFRAGDVVIRKQSYAVYFSGFEFVGGQKTLRLTLVENGANILLTFPSPDVIQIKDTRLKVFQLENDRLEVELLTGMSEG